MHPRCYEDDADRDPETGLLRISETQDLINITYSRDETVAAFKDYYGFLTKMYMDEAKIIEPPEDGWPEITVEGMRPLGKTDVVVDLLRHLPYVRRDPGTTGPQCAGGCSFANWKNWAVYLAKGSSDDLDYRVDSVLTISHHAWDGIPPHVVGLVDSKFYPVFLNTKLGVIYFPGRWDAFPGPIGRNPDERYQPVRDEPCDYAPEEEEEWRSSGGCWAIAEFFEVLKYYFLKLDYVPLGRDMVEESWYLEKNEVGVCETIREIFHQHEWPDMSRYRKAECIEAVEKKIEERWPNTFFAR